MDATVDGKDRSYAAEIVINSNRRVRETFADKILLMYGPAVNAVSYGSDAKVSAINYMMHNGIYARVDNRLANSLGFCVEEVRKRFIGMYDKVNSIAVEIGITHERFVAVEAAITEVAGREYIIGKHSFSGIPVTDLLSHSVLMRNICGTNILVPSPEHQLSLLYIAWLADRQNGSRRSDEALLEHFKGRYGSIEKLTSVPYYFFGVDSKEYARSMVADIGRMLRY